MLEGGRSRGLSASFSTLGGCHLLHDCSSKCVVLAMDPLPTGWSQCIDSGKHILFCLSSPRIVKASCYCCCFVTCLAVRPSGLLENRSSVPKPLYSNSYREVLSSSVASCKYNIVIFIQFSSITQSCPNLCDAMDCSAPGLPVHHLSLLKLMSIKSVMPSSHLILCQPLLLLPSIFPSIRVFSNESVLHIRWPKYWSFSFNISPSNE